MNYISHLNSVFKLFSHDSKLRPTHISLYMALFQFWNRNRFPERFYINRGEVMMLSKIGSLTTYYNCLKGLDERKYIKYLASHDPLSGSQIIFRTFREEEKAFHDKVIDKETPSGFDIEKEIKSSKLISGEVVKQVPEQLQEQVVKGVPEQLVKGVPEQVLAPFINIDKQIKIKEGALPDSEKDVLELFKEKEWPVIEARKFFNYYSAAGWKVGGKKDVRNWRSLAKNWMIRAEEMSGPKISNKKFQKPNYLKTSKNKDYGEPL